MAIKWSPGCGCCDPVGCDEFAIGFTPTTEQDREGYSAWTNFTEYLKDDEFSHYSNNDGWTYLYRVPMTLFSGSGWTSFEESRYTRVRRVDVANELDEWHLYGSGWSLLADSELDAYVRNGRLAEDMGYLSKNDVLPSIESWKADFSYQLVDRFPPQTTIADFAFQGSTEIIVNSVAVFGNLQVPFPIKIGFGQNTESHIVTAIGQFANSLTLESPLNAQYNSGVPVVSDVDLRDNLRVQLFSQMELDGSDNPTTYLVADSTWVNKTEDPPGTAIEEFGTGTVPEIRNEAKIVTTRVVGGSTAEVFDTAYGTGKQTSICRGPDISGGTLIRGVTPGVDSLDLLTEVLRNSCYVALDNGVIAESSGGNPSQGLAVFTGDLIKLDDHDFPLLKESWSVIPSGQISLTDTIRTVDNFENPDPNDEMTGRKVGIFVVKGQAPPVNKAQYQAYDIENFAGVSGSLTRSLERLDCPPCGSIGPVCYGETEFPIFADLIATPEVITAANDTLRNDNTVSQRVFGFNDGFNNTQSFSYSFEDLGVAVRRRSVEEIEWVHVGVKIGFLPFDSEGFGNTYWGTENVMYLVQLVNLSFVSHPGFETETKLTSRVFASAPSQNRKIKSNGESAWVAANFINEGWPLKYYGFNFIEPFGGQSTPVTLASGTAREFFDSEFFDCSAFTLLGTYDIDDSPGWEFAMTGENEVLNKQWTVASV